jgi:hypothetical protein
MRRRLALHVYAKPLRPTAHTIPFGTSNILGTSRIPVYGHRSSATTSRVVQLCAEYEPGSRFRPNLAYNTSLLDERYSVYTRETTATLTGILSTDVIGTCLEPEACSNAML